MANSHDVRKLKPCCLCNDLGIYQPAVASIGWPLVVCLHSEAVAKKDRKYAHPGCYLQEMGVTKLVSLPISELNYIRICDVPTRTMQAILKHLFVKKLEKRPMSSWSDDELKRYSELTGQV